MKSLRSFICCMLASALYVANISALLFPSILFLPTIFRKFWKVLTVVYNTWNYWVFGLFPSGILKT
jgi:hypothetical protein